MLLRQMILGYLAATNRLWSCALISLPMMIIGIMQHAHADILYAYACLYIVVNQLHVCNA